MLILVHTSYILVIQQVLLIYGEWGFLEVNILYIRFV